MVFVDSSCWFALLFEGDSSHARSKSLVEACSGNQITTDHVVVETWLLIRSRFNHYYAETFWRSLRETRVKVEVVTLADLEVAWTIAAHYPDQTFSIVDRTSFAVMERLGISRVISFDNDFIIYRYGAQRDRAFEVLR